MKEFKIIILLLLILPIIYSLTTKNPWGTNYLGKETFGRDVEFIYDLTYENDGKRVHEHRIFDKQMELIEDAEEFILLDIFLYNDEYNRDEVNYPAQVSQMTNLLISKKIKNPNMPIILITDPINNFYGAYEQTNLAALKNAGIEVVVTDLNEMKDSNPLFSGFYRAYLQWFGTSGHGWIRNFFQKDGAKVNIRSILKLINFKGNHRKVYVTEKEAIVASSNPHDSSSLHSNVAVKFYGPAMEDLIISELILVDNPPEVMSQWKSKEVPQSDVKVIVLTEERIYDELMKNIKESNKNDNISLGIFYISEFSLLEELGKASDRGAEVKIIADLNKDAFGLEKNGSPNRPALSELQDKYPKLQIRWYNTTGEQFHTKMAYFQHENKDSVSILGSANFTRRNLRNLNLETDLKLEIKKGLELDKNIKSYYDRIWNNEDAEYTLPLEEYYEDSFLMRILWKVQEKLGLCTW